MASSTRNLPAHAQDGGERRSPPLLLTGFAAFGPHDTNPTAHLMARLNGTRGLVTAVLPVEYDAAATVLADRITRHRPAAVIAFGLAFSAEHILIERVALNLDDAPYPDNAGVSRNGSHIVPDGPVGYWSTLPVEALLAGLAAAGLPVAASSHAGGYVCNHLFYRTRHHIESLGLDLPMGFVHVPPLALDRLLQAAFIIVKTLQGQGTLPPNPFVGGPPPGA